MFVCYFPIFHEQNSRDIADAEFGSQFIVLIHIAFANDDPSVVFGSQFFDDGSNLFFFFSPGSGKIYDHGEAFFNKTCVVSVSNNLFHTFYVFVFELDSKVLIYFVLQRIIIFYIVY